jgi:hypothetical protein
MLGFSQLSSRAARRAWWRRQLSRQQSANLSVTEFCRQLSVSAKSFYYWKRRFQEPPTNVPVQGPTKPQSRPVTIVAKLS